MEVVLSTVIVALPLGMVTFEVPSDGYPDSLPIVDPKSVVVLSCATTELIVTKAKGTIAIIPIIINKFNLFIV